MASTSFFFSTQCSHGTESPSPQKTNGVEVGQNKPDSRHDEAELKTAQKIGGELVHFTHMYINTQEAHLTRNNHLRGDHVSHIWDNFCPSVLSEKMNQSYQLLCCSLFYLFTNSMTKNRTQQYYQNLYFHTCSCFSTIITW